MNMAFMAKLGWRFLNEQDSLWVQVLQKKYVRYQKANVQDFVMHREASNAWRGIVQAKPILSKGVRSLVGNGRNVLFWLDNWLLGEPLINWTLQDISLVEKYRSVNDYWEPGIGWKWNELTGSLCEEIISKLSAFIISEGDEMSDGIYWSETSSGNFSIKTAYGLLQEEGSLEENALWNRVWKIQVPNRIRSFLWLIVHKRIMCNAERVRRGFTANGICEMCKEHIEDVNHLVRECSSVSYMWRHFLQASEFQLQQGLDFDDWLMRNLNGVVKCDFFEHWTVAFAVILWWTWKWRNSTIFK
ncbi:hypothetical protein DITRI_Ditri08aG0108200 [Diplodiscus trichospermus]